MSDSETSLANLPEDPAALKELLRTARAERDRAEQRATEHQALAQAKAALLNLPGWPARDLDAWLPDQWKLRHAASPAWAATSGACGTERALLNPPNQTAPHATPSLTSK